MGVIGGLLGVLWKMFAGDLYLSLAALAAVAVVGIALRLGELPAREAPYVLAAIILVVLATAINLALAKETRKRTFK
jgi:type IV secretory pathway VirB2 component (pilin)